MANQPTNPPDLLPTDEQIGDWTSRNDIQATWTNEYGGDVTESMIPTQHVTAKLRELRDLAEKLTDGDALTHRRGEKVEVAVSAYVIWWTDQYECETIEKVANYDAAWPDYLRSEFRSRLGRAGRGRLWIHSTIEQGDIDWPAHKPASRLADLRGGIVIRAADAQVVFGLPGFLTDLELNYVNALGALVAAPAPRDPVATIIGIIKIAREALPVAEWLINMLTQEATAVDVPADVRAELERAAKAVEGAK